MLHRNFALAWGVLALLLLSGLSGGCGGSSSETPFPLEPDPRHLRPGAPARARYVALPRQGPESEPPAAEPSGQSLPSTWGSSPADKAEEPEPEPEPEPGAPELKNGR